MFSTLAFVWQVWTWSAGEIAIFLIAGVFVSFVFLFIFNEIFVDTWLAVLLSIVLGFGFTFVLGGDSDHNDPLDQETAQQEMQQEGIVHAFEAKDLEVTSVNLDWNTIQIRSSCGDVWSYDLLGSYSEDDLSIDSSSAQHIHGSGEVDSRGFTRTCPPPHEE